MFFIRQRDTDQTQLVVLWPKPSRCHPLISRRTKRNGIFPTTCLHVQHDDRIPCHSRNRQVDRQPGRQQQVRQLGNRPERVLPLRRSTARGFSPQHCHLRDRGDPQSLADPRDEVKRGRALRQDPETSLNITPEVRRVLFSMWPQDGTQDGEIF